MDEEPPVDDFFAQGGVLRADGQMMHDMYLTKVKSSSTSKEPWDYMAVLDTVLGSQAFVPLEKSGCPLAAKE